MSFLVFSEIGDSLDELFYHFLHFVLNYLEELVEGHCVEIFEILALGFLVVVYVVVWDCFLAVYAIAEGRKIFLDCFWTFFMRVVAWRIGGF